MTPWALKLAEDFPTAHQAVQLEDIPDGTAYIEVTFQPDARAAQVVERVELEDGATAIAFTPSRAGIMRVDAKGQCKGERCETIASVEASVKFDSVPVSGLVIFIVAAALLFGGAAMSLRTLMQSD